MRSLAFCIRRKTHGRVAFFFFFFFFIKKSFDFVSAPLVHPRFRRAFGKDGFTRNTPFTRSDMLLSSAG